MPSPGKPWITANQVTVARLIPMPLLSWLIYRGAAGGFQGNPYMWSALIAGTVIGCTDWVDGMLARKYGPTVLGGLLDPIADKVFNAFAYMPFADPIVGLVPPWAVGLMFTREFLITALRSAFEQRGLTMKTSYLAKVKTWTQMQGIGVMLLFPLVENQNILTWSLGVGVVFPLVLLGVLYLKNKRVWRGAIVMSVSILPIFLLALHGDPILTVRVIMFMVVGLTWISGLDYIFGGWSKLRGQGFSKADAVRVIGALVLPNLVFAVLYNLDAPRWPLYTILALELSVGGLDNLLSHHHVATKALAWGGRQLGICVLLGGALLLPAQAAPFLYAAAAVSIIGVTIEFWRGRDYFVDTRIAKREAAA